MSRRDRHLLSLVAGLIALGLLIWLAIRLPPSAISWAGWFFFAVLALFTMTFGVPLGAGEVSFLPMTIVAAALSTGPVSAAWVAYVAALVHGLVRQRWAGELGARREPDLLSLVAVSTANATMHSLSILLAGQAFLWSGGTWSPARASLQAWPLVVMCAAYLGANFTLAGLYIHSLERASIGVYLRSIPKVLAYEATPLLFAPQMALIYARLGLGQFALFSAGLVAVSLIWRGHAQSRRRLERRVRELDSLQAVGRALSTSLELEVVLEAVYGQVSALMPARSLYIALYDAEHELVSFPLAIEDGARVHPRQRPLANGLTEYILRTQAPLLIHRDVPERLRELGVEGFGPPAACWLGVPILAGSESLGVIAVQSYDAQGVYDANHERVLVTIAAQAAAAIQNARLYRRTDEALARRVQELDSILRTTQEGILLLDTAWRIVALNPRLAELVGEISPQLAGQALLGEAVAGSGVEWLGYAAGELEDACRALAKEGGTRQETVSIGGSSGRYIERTLAPVRDQEGAITGWLVALHDITQQMELNRFRDDMAHMLVHDLRSPLAVLRGSLELMENDIRAGNVDGARRWLGAAQSGSDRMLRLIDQLLDISKLESGRMTTEIREVEAAALFEETAQRFAALAREIDVRLQIVIPPDLPPLQVDPALMGRVLGNLVDNALKFTDNGGVIRLWARQEPEEGGGAILLGVSDTGPGISPEAQPLLFQKFQHSSTQGRRRGTGLGLPFCKLAVEAHAGHIWVESPSNTIETVHRGRGSTFVIRLPATLPAGQPQQDAAVSA